MTGPRRTAGPTWKPRPGPLRAKRPDERDHGVILGVDPGTTGMGYALLDPAGETGTLIACGLVPAPPEGSAAERLFAIATALDAIIAEHRPAALALERLYFNKNVRTAMIVAEARGVALLCAARAGLTVAEYTPQEVKRSVTGNGSADKKQVQRMLPLLLSLDAPIVKDNVADAVAIALTHGQRARFAEAAQAATRGVPSGNRGRRERSHDPRARGPGDRRDAELPPSNKE